MKKSAFIRAFLIPAAVFQAGVFGGGYGTGREIVEFISSNGPMGGLLGILIVAIAWGLALAISYEFARRFKVYDYRNFFKRLIGPFWLLFEIQFVFALLLVLAVNSAAAGFILHDLFAIPNLVGVTLVLLSIMALTYYGRSVVEKSMAFWSVTLTLVLIGYCALVFYFKADKLSHTFATVASSSDSILQGFQYALYNMGIIPLLLFCVPHLKTRGEAITGGFFAGFLGAFPALVFHIAFMAEYPAIIEEEIPTYAGIRALPLPYLLSVYAIVLFGLIVQTGVAFLQGLNERLDSWFLELKGHRLGQWSRASISGGAVIASILLSNLGIIALIAKGYGTLAWVILVIYALPLVTVGIYRIIRYNNATVQSDNAADTDLIGMK